VTSKIDFLGAWGIQFGDYNIGVGDPTLAFDAEVVDVYHDSTVGTLDGLTGGTFSEITGIEITHEDAYNQSATVLKGVANALVGSLEVITATETLMTTPQQYALLTDGFGRALLGGLSATFALTGLVDYNTPANGEDLLAFVLIHAGGMDEELINNSADIANYMTPTVDAGKILNAMSAVGDIFKFIKKIME
jgi:hypothetical protein